MNMPFPRCLYRLAAFATFAVASAANASSADAELNFAYKALMEALPAPQQAALREAQRAWIQYRDHSCRFETNLAATVQRGAATTDARDCVTRLTRERLAHLRDYQQRQEMARRATSVTLPRNACDIAERIPAGATVQAVGVYRGDGDTDVQLDDDNETRTVEVTVNRPGEDVVLLLMAYDPVVWTIRRSAATRIVAVIASGYHQQAVLGIERSLPLLVSTYAGRRDCGSYAYAYKAEEKLLEANRFIASITGKEIDRLWGSYDLKRVVIGSAPTDDAALVSPNEYRPEDYTSLPRFPSGQKGLDRLIAEGLLRRANDADSAAWIDKASEPYRRFDPQARAELPAIPGSLYVVLAPMRLPTGLHGAASATFLIPAGVPAPEGKRGHATLLFLEDGTCQGPMCPSHR